MSEHLFQILGHKLPVCVTGNRHMAMHYLWLEIFSLFESFETCCLFVTSGTYAQHAWMSALESAVKDHPEWRSRFYVATVDELEKQQSANAENYRQYCAACGAFIVWLETLCFEDFGLERLINLCHRVPTRVKPIYFVPKGCEEAFALRHTAPFNRESFADNLSVQQPAVYYLSDYGKVETQLSLSFWKRCKNTRTLVSCRCDTHRLRYSEASHRAHIPVQNLADRTDTKGLSENSFQAITVSHESEFYPLDGTWRHLVAIDPLPDTDLIHRAKYLLPLLPHDKKAHLSYVATNRFSLLNILANHGSNACAPTLPVSHRVFEAYALYAGLGENALSPEVELTSDQKQLIAYWTQMGWVAQAASGHTLTSKGRQKFPGIKDLSDLSGLHAWRQMTPCESPNHMPQAWISSDFLRLPVSQRFSLCAQPTQRLFHHLLGNTAILRVNMEPAHPVWLDAMPMICTLAQTRRMEDILFGSQTCEDIEIDSACAEKLAQTQASFEDVPAHYFIEVTSDVAHWWTFAGAMNNAMTAQLLNILAPKLRISYGNCHLRLSWTKSTGCAIADVIRRLKDLSQKILHFAQNWRQTLAISEDTQSMYSAFQRQWQKQHFYSWLFDILPDAWVRQQWEKELELWAASFAQDPLPIIETEVLRAIDPALKLAHQTTESEKPKITPSPKTLAGASKTDLAQAASTHRHGASPKIQAFPGCCLCSETSHAPVICGTMHTRMPWYYVDNPTTLHHALNIILKQPFIGLDVETTLQDQRLCLVQIGCAEQTFLIDPLAVDISGLAHVFAHPEITKVIHNASFEQRVLTKIGMPITSIVDTIQLSRQKHGTKATGGHSLKVVCQREFGLEMSKECQTSRWDRRPLSAAQLEYAALDAEILIHLYRLYRRHV